MDAERPLVYVVCVVVHGWISLIFSLMDKVCGKMIFVHEKRA
jgi:hypothetical protein